MNLKTLRHPALAAALILVGVGCATTDKHAAVAVEHASAVVDEHAPAAAADKPAATRTATVSAAPSPNAQAPADATETTLAELLDRAIAEMDQRFAVDDERDPIEPINRAVYHFNKHLDAWVLQPLADIYHFIVPDPVETGVRNFFGNIGDMNTVINDLLQLKMREAGSDTARVLINTTVGVAGVFDVAAIWGFEKRNEDFGQTLGYWGMSGGPYLVLPLLGPSTARDAFGRVVDSSAIDPLVYTPDSSVRDPLLVIRVIDTGVAAAGLLTILDTASVDGYSFLKESYFQRRAADIADGNMAPLEMDPEFPDDGFPDDDLPGL